MIVFREKLGFHFTYHVVPLLDLGLPFPLSWCLYLIPLDSYMTLQFGDCELRHILLLNLFIVRVLFYGSDLIHKLFLFRLLSYIGISTLALPPTFSSILMTLVVSFSSFTSSTSTTNYSKELSALSSGALLWAVSIVSIRTCRLRTSSNRISFGSGFPQPIPVLGGIFVANNPFFYSDTKNNAA